MLNSHRYLYIVTPIKDEAGKEAENHWESGFTRVIEVLQKIETKLLDHQRKSYQQEVKEMRQLQVQVEKLAKDLRQSQHHYQGQVRFGMQNSLSASSLSQKEEESITPAAKLARILGNSVTVSSSLIDDDEQAVRSDPYMDLKRMILQMNFDMNQKLEGVTKLNN